MAARPAGRAVLIHQSELARAVIEERVEVAFGIAVLDASSTASRAKRAASRC